MKKDQELLAYADEIGDFLRDYLKTSGLKGYVLGLSGGIDSAVVALLLKRAKIPFKCVLLPFAQLNDDLDIAQRMSLQENFDYDVIDIAKTHASIIEDLQKNNVNISRENAGNIKARLRMTYLYSYAQSLSYLVVGTDNYVEYMLGYFTKYGDGGVDILPIVHLLKGEIYDLARLLGTPQEIINRTPSAGFYEGHTDEDELGFTYEEADRYFSGKIVNDETKKKIERLIRISTHKREPLPQPKPYQRKL